MRLPARSTPVCASDDEEAAAKEAKQTGVEIKRRAWDKREASAPAEDEAAVAAASTVSFWVPNINVVLSNVRVVVVVVVVSNAAEPAWPPDPRAQSRLSSVRVRLLRIATEGRVARPAASSPPGNATSAVRVRDSSDYQDRKFLALSPAFSIPPSPPNIA